MQSFADYALSKVRREAPAHSLSVIAFRPWGGRTWPSPDDMKRAGWTREGRGPVYRAVTRRVCIALGPYDLEGLRFDGLAIVQPDETARDVAARVTAAASGD